MKKWAAGISLARRNIIKEHLATEQIMSTWKQGRTIRDNVEEEEPKSAKQFELDLVNAHFV